MREKKKKETFLNPFKGDVFWEVLLNDLLIRIELGFHLELVWFIVFEKNLSFSQYNANFLNIW